MTNELSTVTIKDLEDSYKEFSIRSKEEGEKISKNISMLELDEVGGSIVEAVQTIENIVEKSKEKTFLSKVPVLGKFFQEASEEMNKSKLSNGRVVDTIDQLFSSMSAKQEQITDVMASLFETRERLVSEHEIMLEQEGQTKEIISSGGIDGFKAKNLLVQLQQAIIKTQDRVNIIDTTIKSAEASSMQIAGMLPTLQGELVTELTIQAGLKQLRDYKQIFDKTVELVEEINEVNSDSMQEVLSDVAELAIVSPVDVSRLEKTQAKRLKFQDELKQKVQGARVNQEEALVRLEKIRDKQGDGFNNLLENK